MAKFKKKKYCQRKIGLASKTVSDLRNILSLRRNFNLLVYIIFFFQNFAVLSWNYHKMSDILGYVKFNDV